MTNKDKFLSLVSPVDEDTINGIRFRQVNKLWLRESKSIAVKILLALKELNMTQKNLADVMGVSPQYVNKLVKGKENLTLETIVKLQDFLGIQILQDESQESKNNQPLINSLIIPSDTNIPFRVNRN